MHKARTIKILMVTLILVVGGGALALAKLSGSNRDDAFHGSPVPVLFTDAQIQPVDGPLKGAEARGHELAKTWLDAHPTAGDKEFSAWAVQAIGIPPGATTQHAELRTLKALSGQRDPAGTNAATWLESHGKKQPWKAIRNQTETFVADPLEQTAKDALNASFDLGSTLQGIAKVRYARPSPYQADPSIDALNQARFSGQVRQSYPSKHTVYAGAALAILEPLDPHLQSEYDWMIDEIAFSRMYAGGHYLSDLTAGALLGTLIGDYERRKAGLAS